MRSLLLALAAIGIMGSPARGQPAANPDEDPSTAMVGQVSVEGTILEARVVSAVDGEPANDQPKSARAGQTVTLYAAVAARVAGRKRWFCDAAKLWLDGTFVPSSPMAELPRAALRWYRVEPAVASMSNTQSGAFRFEPIEYRRTDLDRAGRSAVAAEVRPTLTPDHGSGVGTMRFAISVSRGDTTTSSPGPEARRGRGSGGLLDVVHRISIRRDDSYLGYLTEMFGQPYIWASAGSSSRTHQSERLEGSDCADFIIYGARRIGKDLEYTWSGGLPAVTKLLSRGERGDDGVYRDRKGHPLPFPALGDLILFPRHVGALVKDRGHLGVLDDQDVMMHTLFDSPREQAVADSGYAQTTVELRRWAR